MEKKTELRNLLISSVANCIDHPEETALQLSGGLDSSVVQAIAKLNNLYCCTWPEVDNLSTASLASCGRPITPVTFTREEMIEVALPEVAKITGGKGTWSQCCQWFMARAMRKDGIKVVLNGEGSDELFGGYARYRILWWLQRMLDDPHLAEYKGIISYMLGAPSGEINRTLIQRMLNRVCLCNPSAEIDCSVMTQAVGAVDETTGLPELIQFEKDIAASFSIEHRWPFMNPDVVAFAHSLNESHKINSHESKSILRAVARDLGVPSAITQEITKKGLFVPPQWNLSSGPKWSRGWFEELMAEAWSKVCS